MRNSLLANLFFLLVGLAINSEITAFEEERFGKSDCGINCLAVALSSLNIEYELDDLDSLFGSPTERGYSMQQVESVAQAYGAKTMAVETSLENLLLRKQFERFACIAWLPRGHFVIIKDYSGKLVEITDPPYEQTSTPAVFASEWDGHALFISHKPLFGIGVLRAMSWLRYLTPFAVIVCFVLLVGFLRRRAAIAAKLVVGIACVFSTGNAVADESAEDALVIELGPGSASSVAFDLGTIPFGKLHPVSFFV